MPEVIELPFLTQKLENGIVYVIFKENVDVTLENAKTSIESGKKITGMKKYPTIIHLQNIRSISKEARDYFSGKETEPICSAVALIISSPIATVLGNFFLGMNKAIYPLRLFRSVEEAEKWLRSL